MLNNDLSPKWKTCDYSKKQIELAGKTLGNPVSTDLTLEKATEIVDNWRESHAYPLRIIYNNLSRLVKGKNIIVAQRLKRMDSIIKKLQRFPDMSLWRMQDLGGCRMIVEKLDDVYFYANKYENSRIRHSLKKESNYITDPKDDGYRSLHRVYEFHSDSKETFNRNMLIEIQFRTHIQHLWATAVETLDLAGEGSLKLGQGSADLKRFFSLISSLFANIEGTPTVPNTPTNTNDIVLEIRKLNDKNNYLDMLQGLRLLGAPEGTIFSNLNKNNGYYILIFNYIKRNVKVLPFKANDTENANKTYANIESSKNEKKIDAVLVRVSSFKALKKAYPNYFSDITEFINLVRKYIS